MVSYCTLLEHGNDLTGQCRNELIILFTAHSQRLVITDWNTLGGQTPSIFAYCFPVARSVRTTSSPSVVARTLAPLSSDTDPPVKIGWITRSGSKVVLNGNRVVILANTLEGVVEVIQDGTRAVHFTTFSR